MSISIIIVLLIIGLLFVLLEVIAIPGTTIVGFVGFGLIVFAIWMSYANYPSYIGHLMVGSTILSFGVLLFYALKSKTWKKFMLNTKIESKVNVIEEESIKVGDIGITISRLAPAGKVLINGNYYEAHAISSFIDHDTEIVVTKIEQNKIIVKQK